MDSKEVIKEFEGYVGSFVECCESDKYTHQLLESVLDVIEEQEERIAIMSEGGWRDVKADPPKWDCDCIVCADGESQLACARFDKEGMLAFYDPDIYESDVIPGVTHWMPLPEPPKEEDAE